MNKPCAKTLFVPSTFIEELQQILVMSSINLQYERNDFKRQYYEFKNEDNQRDAYKKLEKMNAMIFEINKLINQLDNE